MCDCLSWFQNHDVERSSLCLVPSQDIKVFFLHRLELLEPGDLDYDYRASPHSFNLPSSLQSLHWNFFPENYFLITIARSVISQISLSNQQIGILQHTLLALAFPWCHLSCSLCSPSFLPPSPEGHCFLPRKYNLKALSAC